MSDIRQDNRLFYVRTIRSVSLLLLLAVLITAIFTFYDEININSAHNFFAKLRASQKQDVVFERFDIDGGLSLKYRTLGTGLAVVQSDFFYFVAGNGRYDLKAQLKYRDPKICVSGDKALIYDCEGEEYTIATSYAVLYRGKADGVIISASLNESGDYALVTNPSGYRAAVTVYNAKNKEKCKWETSKDFIAMSAVSLKGGRFSALCFEGNGLSVKCFDAQKGEQIYSQGVSGSVYAMYFDKNDLILVTDSKIIRLDDKGDEETSAPLSDPVFIDCDKGFCQTVTKETGGYTVTLYNEKLEKKDERTFSENVIDAEYKNGVTAILTDNNVTVYSGENISKTACPGGKEVMLSSDGMPVIRFNDRIERVGNDE